jgi:hypothetical protein
MRKLEDVINQMIEVSTNKELNQELEKIKSDISFTAPELIGMRWDLTHEALCSHMPNPVANDESVQIFSIFTTMTEEDFKAQFN